MRIHWPNLHTASRSGKTKRAVLTTFPMKGRGGASNALGSWVTVTEQ